MANNMNEVVQLLKYIKSLKGDYQGFAQHTNSRDIDTITICCAILTLLAATLLPALISTFIR